MTDDRNLPARGDELRPPARGRAPESGVSGGAPAGTSHPDEIELREILGILRRRVGWVIAGVVLAVAVAGILIWRSVPEYRAEAALRVVNEREAMTAGFQAPGLDRALGRSSDPLLSEMQVLRSRRVLGTVVEREGLRLSPASPEFPRHLIRDVVVEDAGRADTLEVRFGPDGFHLAGGDPGAPYGQRVELDGLFFTIADDPGVEEATLLLRPRDDAVEWVRAHLSATRREDTDAVDVRFTSYDPRLAQRVVNSIMTVFKAVDQQSAQEEARRRRVFIEEQLRSVDSLLVATQAELSAFRSREEIYSSRERLAAEQSGLFGLQVRREELAAQRRMVDRMLDRARSARSSERDEAVRALVSSPGLAENPVVVQLYERLARAEAARDSLTEGEWGSAATNPDVARLDSLAAQTERGILDAAGSYIASLDARVEALDELRERNAAALRTLPETESQEMRLVQRVETIRKMSEQLREEYQRAQIAEAVEAGQVEILDAAVVPDEPVGTGSAVKLALALMLGLMLGSGAAFVREHLDTAVHKKEDVERVLGLSPLGVVPRLDVETGTRRLSLPGRGNGRERMGQGAVGAGISREVVAVHDQKSSGAEAYRTLRTNLLFSQLGEELRTVVVTSAMAAEGKTTVASNLATTFAQQGVRVLLVDADLRKARLHRTFGVEKEPGLTECVLGRASVEEVIRGTAVDGLHVLPAGTLPPNPSELLGSDRMRKLLDTLREGYELVLFDSPPLLAAGDAAVLGARADGVVLVVRAGETDQGAAKEAVRQLDLVRARILGAVLNDPDEVVGRYGGYYSYAYYGE